MAKELTFGDVGGNHLATAIEIDSEQGFRHPQPIGDRLRRRARPDNVERAILHALNHIAGDAGERGRVTTAISRFEILDQSREIRNQQSAEEPSRNAANPELLFVDVHHLGHPAFR